MAVPATAAIVPAIALTDAVLSDHSTNLSAILTIRYF